MQSYATANDRNLAFHGLHLKTVHKLYENLQLETYKFNKIYPSAKNLHVEENYTNPIKRESDIMSDFKMLAPHLRSEHSASKVPLKRETSA